MSGLGEHEIEPHPRGAWRAFVAGCVAVGLLLLGLIVSARAETPLTIAGTPGPMAEVLQHAADLAAKQGPVVKVIIFSDWVTPNACWWR
jgi:ABC-type metal ion transport system substrate-binding protein